MVSTALEASWAIKNCHPEQQVAYKHMHTSPCHSSKGVSCAPCVGFPKEHSLPACMVMVGVAQAPVWVLMPYPGCQGPASASLPGGLRGLLPLPGQAAYHTAFLILSHVQDSQACPKQGGNTSKIHLQGAKQYKISSLLSSEVLLIHSLFLSWFPL